MKWTIFLIMITLSACSTSKTDVTDLTSVRQAISKANREYISAYEKGSAAEIARLYDQNAVILQVGIEPIEGRDRIERQYVNFFDQSKFKDVSVQTQDVDAAGNFAYEHGKYSLTVSPVGLTAASVSGKYLVVWQKQSDGKWLIRAEMRQPNI